MIYQIIKPTPFNEFSQYDIHYFKSTNQRISWIPYQFTRYVDDDILLGIENFNNKPLVVFQTSRFLGFRINNIGLGIIEITNDLTPPPVIFKI